MSSSTSPMPQDLSVFSTGWRKPPSMTDLKNDLQMATQSHDALIQDVDRWNNLMKVKGPNQPKGPKNRSRVQPKVIRRQAEWRYSALTEPFLGSQKLFKIEPVTAEDIAGSKQNELLLNHQFRTKIDRVKFIDDYVRSNVDDGSVVIRVGWIQIKRDVLVDVPTFDHMEIEPEDQETLEQLQQAMELKQEDPRTFDETVTDELRAAIDYMEETGTPTVAVLSGTRKEKKTKVVQNHPTAEILNIRNFYVDPTCGGDLDKAMFVVVSFETSKSELAKEPNRYKNLDRVNWETATPVTETQHTAANQADYSNNFRDLARKKVVAYEYWGFVDVNGTGELKPVVITWIGDTIIRMEENPFPDEKLPFVVVSYLPRKLELFGETDAELLEDNQKIIGALTRGMIDLLGRSANGQRGFRKGMLDVTNRRRYDNGQDYEYNPDSNPEAQIIEHKYPEIPASAINLMTMQNQDGESLTGVKSFSGGISGNAYGDVAAGIRGVLDAASKREMAILRRMASGIVKLGKKFVSMNQAFLSKEEVIRVTNEEFVTIRKEDIKGEFDLKVDIATAEVDDAQAKDLGFMLQTIGPDLDNEITMMLLSEIAELKRMPTLAKKLKNWKPTPDPLQEQMKKLEIQRMELENRKLQSEVELNEAKAKAANSTADAKDLEYVETESGTKHARDMEKMQAQAQGNQDLQITKALTAPKKDGETAPKVEEAIGYNALTKQLDGHSPSSELERGAPAVDNTLERDELAGEGDPRYSIGSRFFDPSADPTLNPSLNIGA